MKALHHLIQITKSNQKIYKGTRLTFLSREMLSCQAFAIRGENENWVSLKYLVNISGLAFRTLTTRSATISSSVACFNLTRNCRRTMFPALDTAGWYKYKEDEDKMERVLGAVYRFFLTWEKNVCWYSHILLRQVVLSFFVSKWCTPRVLQGWCIFVAFLVLSTWSKCFFWMVTLPDIMSEVNTSSRYVYMWFNDIKYIIRTPLWFL